jgi:hypothetical protein
VFDRDREVARWRAQLLEGDSLRPQDAEELEEHLRTTLEELEGIGLAPHEAFLVATRRLGSTEELRQEFVKLDGARPWMRRVRWMLLGYLAITVGLQLLRLTSDAVAMLALFASGDLLLSTILRVVVLVGAPAAVLWIAGRRLVAEPKRWEGRLARLRDRAVRKKGLVLLLAGALAIGILAPLGNLVLFPLHTLMFDREDFVRWVTASRLVSLATTLLIPLVAVLWIAWSLRRERLGEAA